MTRQNSCPHSRTGPTWQWNGAEAWRGTTKCPRRKAAVGDWNTLEQAGVWESGILTASGDDSLVQRHLVMVGMRPRGPPLLLSPTS